MIPLRVCASEKRSTVHPEADDLTVRRVILNKIGSVVGLCEHVKRYEPAGFFCRSGDTQVKATAARKDGYAGCRHSPQHQ